MKRDKKATGRASSMPAGLAFGACVSMALTLAAAGILAKMLDEERLEWENIGYAIAVLLLAASFSGAMAAYGKVKRQRMAVCLAAGAVYLAILLCLTALFFGGQYEAVGTTAVLIMGGSLAAGLLGLRDAAGKGSQKLRIGHR